MAKVLLFATSAAKRLVIIAVSLIMYNHMYKEKFMPLIVHFGGIRA
ncbi:hypothetical protein SJJBTUD_0026 [Escherichia phage Ayreon]|nr:hypothetical protein SJJBTUD_0026 [Escherichia phage Ayreon]